MCVFSIYIAYMRHCILYSEDWSQVAAPWRDLSVGSDGDGLSWRRRQCAPSLQPRASAQHSAETSARSHSPPNILSVNDTYYDPR